MMAKVTDPDLLKQLGGDQDTRVNDPELLKQLDAPAESTPWYGQLARGAARGVAGLVQSAHEVLPQIPYVTSIPDSALTPRASEARKAAEGELRKFTDAPSEGAWETGGRLAGQYGPMLLIPGVGAESALGSIAERAAIGGVAGGLQPTTEHTAASHIPGAVAGATTGAAGRALTQAGVPLGYLAAATGGHTVGGHVARAAAEQPIEWALTGLGVDQKTARKYAGTIAAALFAAGLFTPTGAPMSVPGSIAARLASGAAGSLVEKFSGKKSRSSERQ
jgi:hypothetical protein